MKQLFFTVVLLATVFTQNIFAQDNTKPSLGAPLLSFYYNIKDALVAGNAATAASEAEAFAKAANGIDYKVISEGNIFILVKDADKISGTKNLQKQREYFANLSSNMMAVAKAVKLIDEPVYNAWCPMKKAYWLSREKAIKNPYYGSSMLTCGEVTETFK